MNAPLGHPAGCDGLKQTYCAGPNVVCQLGPEASDTPQPSIVDASVDSRGAPSSVRAPHATSTMSGSQRTVT